MQNQLISVQFYEDTVVLVNKDNEALIAMKPIVTNMGLDWKSQHTKLTEKFGSVMVEITTTGGDGKQYKMSCLPLRKLPAWLYSISPNKVKSELREKIIRYQEECDDTLYDYWSKGSAIRTGAPNVTQQIALSRHRVVLLKELHQTRDNGLRAALHEQLALTSRQLGVSVPDLNTIGIGIPGVSEVASKLWNALEILDRKGERYNHAPWLSGMIYLKLSHLSELFKKHGIALHFDAELRHAMKESKQPKFLIAGSKGSSIEGKTIRCWVFEGSIKLEPDINSRLSR